MTPDLFEQSPYPPGFSYRPEFLSEQEEAALVEQVALLPLKEFEFHGFTGKRRTASFGWKYDFSAQRLQEAEPFPPFLLPFRAAAAAQFALRPDAFEQMLVTEYAPGAGIGWHKDRSVFGVITGISLAAPGLLRLRRGGDGKWQRISVEVAPRSIYLFEGEARSEWEHSIPPVSEKRYSITLRTLARLRNG
ncbi:MAG: alkylated repair protein [Devosia sp.]|uniref:alpha-ketoglutarate-dependent dioxygenase AlkB n=1 Tax=Devosia sp. TaxID=1871048 RepID=UPI00260ACDEB|nr:alpha-ketoglutarate-dependent dioxygenase AlkB [Devosia sp.]MDB5539959.1 alkylated repair protein [Devosia sp.]